MQSAETPGHAGEDKQQAQPQVPLSLHRKETLTDAATRMSLRTSCSVEKPVTKGQTLYDPLMRDRGELKPQADGGCQGRGRWMDEQHRGLVGW